MTAMGHFGAAELLLMFALGLLLFGPKSPQEIAAIIRNGIDKFRGGPGSPSHPIPANDSRVINRKRKAAKEKSGG